ncbi:MAG: fatty acid desaturase [Gammaproteobacteria bacterium]|jgi:stearoyl-CoA desaturase (delta-9 desaturase)
MDYLYGFIDLDFWGYVLVSFIMVQTTVLCVTLYLHRDAAHRGLDLHPALRHFARFWLWVSTGISTREWVAIHRKHHARCETPDDPHSPQVEGLKKVLLEGAELYQEEADNLETIEKYGRGTPDDWLERRFYSHQNIGITLFVIVMLLLFGVPGIIMIAVQMVSQPLLAAGIINGVGHYYGYRNFECDDASRNVVPWGLLLGGEELHNNHHAFPSSAKFSIRPWEADIGWGAIVVLRTVGLAKVRRVAPKPTVEPGRSSIDLETARAVIVNRMHVLRDYTRTVTLPVLKRELADLKAHGKALPARARKLLVRQPALLDAGSRDRLRELLASNQKLKTVHEFRERLRTLWDGATMISNERLIAQLREWCQQAEASGVRGLQEFAATLRGYTISQGRPV